jgi:hypothetical protein
MEMAGQLESNLMLIEVGLTSTYGLVILPGNF